MESSNSNSKERELQLTQRLSKQRHSICMAWFEQLETHLHDLYLLNSPYAVDAFKPAFCSFFDSDTVNKTVQDQSATTKRRRLVTESTTVEANLTTDVKALMLGQLLQKAAGQSQISTIQASVQGLLSRMLVDGNLSEQ
ncbi:hypothetical protein Tco_0319712 [Tanacetum coccineum]